jgi:hypothetical protein
MKSGWATALCSKFKDANRKSKVLETGCRALVWWYL